MERLPFDVFHCLSEYLEFEDYMNLSRVSKYCHGILGNDLMVRDCLKHRLKYTVEAGLVAQGKCAAREAIGRVHKRRNAFANAQPFVVGVVSIAKSFIYEQGQICYLSGDHIYILDTHLWSQSECMIGLTAILKDRGLNERSPSATDGWRLLTYAYGRLACSWEDKTVSQSWLVIVTLDKDQNQTIIPSFSTYRLPYSKVVVRLSRDFVCVGKRGAAGREDHEWEFWILRAHGPRGTVRRPVSLGEFQGKELGTTVVFEIFGDYLYGVSTEAPVGAEGIDWISYYHCIRISLTDKARVPEECKIWRRDHLEGVLNDSWLQLSLQKDEQDGHNFISEVRKEWPNGDSFNTRIHYKQRLESDEWTCITPNETPQQITSQFRSGSPDCDDPPPPLEPPMKRSRRHVHQEKSPGTSGPPSPEYILAHTACRFYDASSMSFLDVIKKSVRSSASGSPSHLAVRVVSRNKRHTSFDDNINGKRPFTAMETNYTIDDSEYFSSRPAKMWPLSNPPPAMLSLLDTTSVSGEMNITADNRNIVYLAKGPGLSSRSSLISRPSKLSALVIISFDPACNLPGLTTVSIPKTDIKPEEANHLKEILLPCPKADLLNINSEPTAGWQRPAPYLTIKTGFRFRYDVLPRPGKE